MVIIDWLKLSETEGIKDLDNPSVTALHSGIISRKGFLKRIYTDYYREFKAAIGVLDNGSLVELGSGGGFIKQIVPGVITSDISVVEGIDLCLSGECMPFRSNVVDGLFMLNTLHHIKKPGLFLEELTRVLKSGGKAVLIDPASTLWSRFIFKTFHHEDFDPEAGWEPKGRGRLTSANDALSWIIFVRDRQVFGGEFPELRIKRILLHTPLRYLFSGGLTLKQIVPSWSYRLVKGMEYLLTPFNKYIGMFMSVELEKI